VAANDSDGAGARRPRVLVLNQYYRPGVEATAHLLAELCDSIAVDMDVTVITGRTRQHPELTGQEERSGVRVVRVESTAHDRTQLGRRALNYVTYLLLALREGLRSPRPDVVLCMTDPPVLANMALVVARRHRVPLIVVSQDVFPEVAVELGRLESRALVALLRALVSSYLRRADYVVAIGETMRRRLVAKGAAPDRLRVIPNWVDTTRLQPQPKANAWSRAAGLHDRFVVMHSGNVGHAQDLDSLVRAATFLRDLERLELVIIGRGARQEELTELGRRLEIDRLRFLPYQPRRSLSDSLSAADVHVVGLASGLAGYVVPSRLYGILAVGRPVIAAADEESETARLVHDVGCGLVVPPGRPDLLAGAIREAYDGVHDLREMGRRGRAWVEREADRSVALARYHELLLEATAGRR
jgi:glycosyltransferase involved in cell wall biosynthesis